MRATCNDIVQIKCGISHHGASMLAYHGQFITLCHHEGLKKWACQLSYAPCAFQLLFCRVSSKFQYQGKVLLRLAYEDFYQACKYFQNLRSSLFKTLSKQIG